MTDLPDVNVWLALADANHSHHSAAQRYWLHQAAPSVAFCRVSMLGFIRLATHPKVLSRPLSPVEVWDIYRQYLHQADIEIAHENAATEAIFQTLTCQSSFSPPLWTDAWIAAFALSHGWRVVSFDADFNSFAGLDFLHLTL